MHSSGLPMLNRSVFRPHHFRCPDEHDLACYVDQQLIGAERKRVESHVAECDHCLRQIGSLLRHSDPVTMSVPAWFLEGAKQLQTAPETGSPVVWAWARVAAAIAVVTISVVLWREVPLKPGEGRAVSIARVQQRQVAGIPNLAPEAKISVRRGSPGVSRLVVLSPRSAAIVHPSDFIIRWQPIANAVSYEVRVVTADGSLVWRKRVHEAPARPPTWTLRAGKKYFVWVRAMLPDGDSQLSPAVGFIAGGNEPGADSGWVGGKLSLVSV